MKVKIAKSVHDLYLKYQIDINIFFEDYLYMLRLKQSNDLSFDYMMGSESYEVYELELSGEVEILFKKLFINKKNYDKAANIIAANGIMLGGVI